MAAKPTVPTSLGVKARKVWREITDTYELRIDELRILEDACREIDLIERLEKELKGSDLVVHGSMGQPVASPLVQEIRQHRAVLARLLGWLKLSDVEDADSAGSPASSAARRAAQARWGRGA